MANEYRNQRARRTTGDDWREDAGYGRQPEYRGYYPEYQGYRSDYDYDYGTEAGYRGRQDYGGYDSGNRDSWRRRSVNEMEDYPGTPFGAGSGAFGTGSYGASGYSSYMGGYGDYDRQRSRQDQYRSDYMRSENPYNRYDRGYSSDYGYRGRQYEGYGYNRPGYGRDYEREYSAFDRDRDRRGDRDWWDRAGDEVASWFGDDDAERRRRMDKQQSNRGRGPKGYKRSDERIREDINDRLSDDHWVDASDIEVSVNNSEVTLSGNVYDRTTKRRAEDIAESVSGVRHIENRIRVSREETSDFNYPTATTTGGSLGTDSRAETSRSRSTTSRSV